MMCSLSNHVPTPTYIRGTDGIIQFGLQAVDVNKGNARYVAGGGLDVARHTSSSEK